MKARKRCGRWRIGIAILLCATLTVGKVTGLQAIQVQAATEGTIIASSLYVRSGPSTSYSKMTVNGQDVYLSKNTVVDILDEKDGWYYIVTTFGGQTVKGYVSGKYVSVETTPTKAPTKTPAPTKPAVSSGNLATEFSVPAQIWVTELNIRQSAGTSGALLDTLKSGASVTVIGQTYAGTEKWYKVTYQSGGTTKTGYAYAPYVTLNAAIPTATPTPKVTATPKPSQNDGNYADEFSVSARVTASVVNVRSGAGTGNSIITSLKFGTPVTATGITKVNGETWYRISYMDNGVKKVGYAYGLYITLDGAIPTATPKPTATPVPTATPKPTSSPDGLIKDYEVPATVIANSLNMRAKAGTNSTIVAVLIYNTKVTATGSCYVGEDKWYCIELTINGEKKSGYVYGEYLQLSAPEPTPTPTSTPTPIPTPTDAPAPGTGEFAYPAKVTATQLNLRSGAGTEHEALKLLSRDDALKVVGEAWKGSDKWYKVQAGDITGYVLSDYVCLDLEKAADAILTEQVRLRQTASDKASYVKTGAGSIAVLKADTGVSLIEEQTVNGSKWFRISYEKDGEVIKGYAKADSMKFGKPVVKPTSTPTPAPTATPTPAPTSAPDDAKTPTPTPKPDTTKAPTSTSAPTSTPGPKATPAAQAKENTAGKQEGWGRAVHPSGNAVILKVLPDSGADSVKVQSGSRAVTVSSDKELMLYALYVDEKGSLYRHVGYSNNGFTYYGYVLESLIKESAGPVTPGAPRPDEPVIDMTPKPAKDAKENTAGVQVGWGHATHPNASAMVLKSLPDSSADSVKVDPTRAVTVTARDYLMLYGLYVDERGDTYRHLGVKYRGKEYYGYILESRITECEAPDVATPTPGIGVSGSQNGNQGVHADFEIEMDIQGFPESYKPYLRALHEQYPNWIFKAFRTGLDWDTAIDEENIPGKNLIPNSSGIAWKSLEEGAYNWKTDSFIVYDGSTWVTASRAALEYYMDPRNFLDEKAIFQFEVLNYEPDYQHEEGVENILKYTPLYQTSYTYVDENGRQQRMTYAETFIKAAEYSGVSPYHLATRVKQEVVTGTSTVSNSVTGKVKGFEGLYNFYNIGAYHSTQAGGAIANGLKYARYGNSKDDALNDASLIPWDNRYNAIVGGAYIIGSSYINRGQNTIYLQKFNMTSYYTYSHQYMANVAAPSSEGRKTAQAYAGATESPVVFSIPVYLNMPARACPEPTTAYNPNNYLSKLSVKSLDGTSYALTPSFNGASVTEYSVFVLSSTEVIDISATTVSKKASVFGDGYQNLSMGMNTFTVAVIAEDGSKREYVLYVVRE